MTDAKHDKQAAAAVEGPPCATCRHHSKDRREIPVRLHDGDQLGLGLTEHVEVDVYACMHPKKGGEQGFWPLADAGDVAPGTNCALHETPRPRAALSPELEQRLRDSAARAERDTRRGQ